MTNHKIVNKLREHATQLSKLPSNLYRVKAYRHAAEAIERLTVPVSDLVEKQGVAGLQQVPGIGSHLAFAIERLVKTGEFHALTRHSREMVPEDNVCTLPGVGPRLAQLLWEKGQVLTINQLEGALGKKQFVETIGEKRCHKLRSILRQRREQEQASTRVPGEPSLRDLLWVDKEYRRLARANCLPTIAPSKFNPANETWLPLFFTRRHGWKFRALYSNTALAHRLGQTRDWVVVYFSNDSRRGQRTIVTENRGELRGQRVVRGRENESQSPEQEKKKECCKESGSCWK